MKQSGATLLEFMAALAVSAILLTIGIPSFAALIHSTRLTSATNALVSSLHLARSEAIKRGSRVAICPSATGSACTNGGWHQGWVVFHDANNNVSLDAGEQAVLIQPSLPTGLWVTSKGSTAGYISYAPSGETRQISGAWQAGTLTLCNESGPLDAARQVIISRTGRPRTARVALASCPAA